MTSEKRRIMNDVIMIGGIVAVIVLGVRLFSDRRYTLVSMMIAFLACFFFYLTYERKEGSIRRMVMIAVMTTITVISRLIFGAVPGFKPMSSIIILTGIFMGPECGFLVGSLSALTSNIFFGQGPWTPFQMLTWGIIGFLSGLPGLRKVLRNRIPLLLWGMLMGMLYSGIMDIWTVLDLTGMWSWKRYLMALSTAVPYIIAYMSSNVVFLMIGLKPLGESWTVCRQNTGFFKMAAGFCLWMECGCFFYISYVILSPIV